MIIIINDFRDYDPEKCNDGGRYSFQMKFIPIKKDLWEIHYSTSCSEFDYCSKCGSFHRESECMEDRRETSSLIKSTMEWLQVTEFEEIPEGIEIIVREV